jgi:hypothetical protein
MTAAKNVNSIDFIPEHLPFFLSMKSSSAPSSFCGGVVDDNDDGDIQSVLHDANQFPRRSMQARQNKLRGMKSKHMVLGEEGTMLVDSSKC